MNRNQIVFFELLKLGLWRTPENLNHVLFNDVNWEEVYRLASEQSVVGLIAAGIDYLPLDARPPQKITLQFVGEALQIEQKNRVMNDFLAEIIEILRGAGVYALLLKGQGIAQCYEKPLWRSCGDIDLFLSIENYKKAKIVLQPLAYSLETEYDYTKHLGMTIKGWVVELHGTLRCKLSKRIDHTLDEIQGDTFYHGNVRSWLNGRSQVFMLRPENDAVYVFTHFLNHFYKEGLGLRQICDWCRLLFTYREELDFSLLEQWMKKMGLMMEWQAFGAFAVEYLGMPISAVPLLNKNEYQNEKLKRKSNRIKNFILMSGNFGHNRDMSHFEKFPFIVRKCISMGRRMGDLINHTRIFPMNSVRFFPRIMYNGVLSAVKGEG